MISGEIVNVSTGQKAVSNATGDLVQAPASPGEYPPDPEVEDLIEPELDELDEDPMEKSSNDKPAPVEKKPKVKETKETQAEKEVEENNLEEEVTQEVEEPNVPDGPPPKPFSMGLGIGSATLDGVLYNQLALRPEINIWKVGIGLDLVLYVDNEGNMRNEEWDIENDPGLLLDKILYVRYGRVTDPVWIKYGSIEGKTMGYGGLLNSYSNMMEFPTVRRVGINTGFNIGPVGGELFLSNIKDISRGGTIAGFRMAYTVSDDIPLTIGVNYITDANMFSGLKDKDSDSYPDIFDDFPDDSTLWNDTDGDGWPDPGHGDSVLDSLIDIDADGDNIIDANENEDEIDLKATPFSLKNNKAITNALSFDIGYPILDSDLMTLKVYSEYNQLNFPGFITSDSTFKRPERSGSGITLPGLRSTLFGILNLSLEYRMISGSYVPQFFDQAYDPLSYTHLTLPTIYSV